MKDMLFKFFIKIKTHVLEFFARPGFYKRLLRYAAWMFAGVFFSIGLLIALVWMGALGSLPERNELRQINNALASEVYSADSVLLGRYFFQDRSPVDTTDIPESLKQALIATEDIRFYEHSGIDYKSLGRVIVKSILLQKESSGGGSTLTQQLAKNLYPRESYAFLSLPVNKIREFIIAYRLEEEYTKDEILVLYLNTIPFADNTYGIKTAADRFFSVPVKSLTTEQGAVLIGMLKATHSYNPRLFPDRAKQRRDVVIAQMTKYGFMNAQQKELLQNKPLELRYNNTSHNTGIAPYFRATIQRELLSWCKENKKKDGTPYNLYTDGLKIYTTLDSRLQRYAEQAVKSQMQILQERFKGQLNKPQLDALVMEILKQQSQYKNLQQEGFSPREIMAILNRPIRTKIFSWNGEQEADISIYDSIKHHIQFLQSGLLAIDPLNGEVKAWVGGINFQYFQFDHVRESTKRQVGSTIKPIVYAAALESGIGPCSYISARKTAYSNMEDWTPENSSAETYDRKYSMQGGLSGSVNTVSIKLLEQTGIQNTIAIARKMGITSELPAVPSLALGTPSISMMEMVSAYCVLANEGSYIPPVYLSTITDAAGNVMQQFGQDRQRVQALSKETAQMMIHMMKSVISEGTGSSLKTRYGIHHDIAGKTGTTQSNVDGWFIALTPSLVVGAWVGADNPKMHFKSTALGQGAATALPVVAKLFQQVNEDPVLRKSIFKRFEPLPDHLTEKLTCESSKSNLNILERIFKKKKKIKVTKFKGSARNDMP
jgi:penicillin-binding protein 1A